MNTEIPDNELVATLAKAMVIQVAPEELDLFDELFAAHLENPAPPDLTARASDDPLGFGWGELIVAVTPAAAAVASAALSFVLSTLLKAAQNEGAAQIQKRIKERLTPQAKTAAPLLNPAQLEQLKQVTLAEAQRYGMSESQAEQLSNAVLVSLVLGKTSGAAPKHVKILFLAASPSELDHLELDQEIRDIDHALRAGQFRDRFEVEQHWAVRISDLQEVLLRHAPDIVHFSGHGSEKGALLFEGPDNALYAAPPDAIADLFRVLKDNVRCVVLNACYTQAQAQAISAHVASVVYMSDAMDDPSALQFSSAFYQALAFGRDVQTAFELGVNHIRLERGAGVKIPQLLARSESARDLRFV